MTEENTICALSTPAGQGAIAVIRMSGSEAVRIAESIFKTYGKKTSTVSLKAQTIHYGIIADQDRVIDEVIVSLFREPHSYTGEDVVEISCHGSRYIQQEILKLLISRGARLAKPGEFTQRAFLNGKMDLSQAEGVADLIASGSAAAHRLAMNQMRGGFSEEIRKLRNELLQFVSLIELELDFSEEDVEFADRKQLNELLNRIDAILSVLIRSFQYGNAVRNGVPVAIIGPTNAGKSTLLNRLLREEKAIVSEIAGTTRDYIEDTIILEGIEFRFIDTAGLRNATDAIEAEGISRTLQKYRKADIVIVVMDITGEFENLQDMFQFLSEDSDTEKSVLFALNKCDLLDPDDCRKKVEQFRKVWRHKGNVLAISAREGESFQELEQILVNQVLQRGHDESGVVVTNIRHYEALLLSSQALERAKTGLETTLATDLIAQDIREILHYLGEITGEITTDEILGNIFRNFCIGK